MEIVHKKIYKCGYCAATVEASDFRHYVWLKEIAEQCEQFVLGIPDVTIIKKLKGENTTYDPIVVKEYWSNIKWIDDVVILSENELSYQKAYDMIRYDVCFYGSEYGTRFQSDIAFMKAHGIKFIPILPNKLKMIEGVNALELSTKYYRISKKIILFGTGVYFEHFMKKYGGKCKPAYAIDNSKEKWGTKKEGIYIKNTSVLLQENVEDVFIIICSKNYTEMLAQLQQMGNYDYRLLLYTNEIASLEDFSLCRSIEEDTEETIKKIQKINYKMLEEFDKICRLHDVQYFLNYGSLLGAVRHKGFIPWDNDIDTIMTRDNYDKLSQFQDEFDKRYYWLPSDLFGNKKYYDCVPRLGYKAAYICLDEEACRFYMNNNNRIHLDMFLIDKTYDNFWGKLQRFELAVIYGLMNAYRHESFFFDYDNKMKLANAILKPIGKYISLTWLRNRADKVARRFNKDTNAPYFFISNDVLRKLNMLFPKEIFESTVDMKFGEINAKVACGYDAMCRIIFGEYMNLPPKEERVPHLGRLLITSDLYVFQEPDNF